MRGRVLAGLVGVGLIAVALVAIVAVVAGMARPGTQTVRLDGTPVTVAQDPPGLVDDANAGLPVFAGEVALDGDAVTVTALGGDGAVLAECTVTPADVARASATAPEGLEALRASPAGSASRPPGEQ